MKSHLTQILAVISMSFGPLAATSKTSFNLFEAISQSDFSYSRASNFDFDGHISYENFQRLNEPVKRTDFEDWAAFRVNATGMFGEYDFHHESEARFYINNENQINFSLPETYLEYRDSRHRLSVGRQILNWNENEFYWQLDTINYNQGFYLLGEKKEGLTGIQYDYRPHENVKLSFFFSYLNIPALNPSVSIENGKVSSNSEWVRGVPEGTKFQGETVPLYYVLNMPDLKDIVLKKSLGLRQAFSWNKGTSEFSSYAIYKPENSIRQNAEAFMDESLDKINVIANPIVNHHLVYGLQFKQKLGDLKLVVGFDVDDPNAKIGKDFKVLSFDELKEQDKVFESEFFTIKPSYDKESYFHTTANLNRGNYMASLNYIHLMSENSRASDDFFGDTVKWKRTVGSRLRYYFTDYFNVMGDYKYDLARKDHIIKTEASYTFLSRATVNIGMELIKSPQNNSYWSAYRANDTVYTSLKLLF